MSTVEVHLKALLVYSGNEQFISHRQQTLCGINDDELSTLLKKAMEREFARCDLEHIVLAVLDVIARDPASVNGNGIGESQATSLKDKQDRGVDTQPRAEHEILPTSSIPRPTDTPALAMQAGGKRSLRNSTGPDTHKRAKPTDDVAPTMLPPRQMRTPDEHEQSNDTPADTKISTYEMLVFCETEQLISNKTVRPEVVYRYKNDNHHNLYYDFTPGDNHDDWKTLISEKFEKDYLSNRHHLSQWVKYLQSRDGLVIQSCVNRFVIGKTKVPSERSIGDARTACDFCINTKRLCAGLVRLHGQIKLCFYPLPVHLRLSKPWYLLASWVCE